MKIKLENVGKIKEANIELNGITIIAGENSTGKSTVGKMLFCVYNSFFRIEEQIYNERKKTIHRVISNYAYELFEQPITILQIKNLSQRIVDKRASIINDNRILIKELENFCLPSETSFKEDTIRKYIEELDTKILEYLKIEDNEIKKLILKKRLQVEFGMKVGYLNTPNEETNICLEIRDSEIKFKIKEDKISIAQDISLMKEIIYIDDPFVLDELEIGLVYKVQNEFQHRSHLLMKIAQSNSNSEFSVLDEFFINEKLQKIFNTMTGICDGELILDKERGSYIYKTDELSGGLGISNLSTGMKNFLILRTLLYNGSIDENGIIILDEPEIHLHPEWQLKFAEIIVQIQKEFGMNILLNTHSPYFLNAIQVYSDKYGITDKCKYYLTEEQNRRVNIIDVTKEIEKIYEKLARPLKELENLEYNNETTRQ